MTVTTNQYEYIIIPFHGL